MYVTFVSILLCVCANLSYTAPVICKLADSKCTAQSRQDFYQYVLEKNPETGTEDLDPMYHDVIDGKLSIVTYQLRNSTLEGFKKCKVDIFEFNNTTFVVHLRLLCPQFKMYGTYDMHGMLTKILPIEGNGDYDLLTHDYSVDIRLAVEVLKESDGKRYVATKLDYVKAEALAPISFNFQNLFNGQKDLAEAVHKYSNENWKEVSDGLQGPAFIEHIGKMVSNINKIFKRIPAEDVI